METKRIYMARLEAIQDQGYSWQRVSFFKYLLLLLSGEEVRIDHYDKKYWN